MIVHVSLMILATQLLLSFAFGSKRSKAHLPVLPAQGLSPYTVATTSAVPVFISSQLQHLEIYGHLWKVFQQCRHVQAGELDPFCSQVSCDHHASSNVCPNATFFVNTTRKAVTFHLFRPWC